MLNQPDISLALANRLVEATLVACHAENKNAVVAVVDRAGNLVDLQRDDAVTPQNTDAVYRKAYTALSTKTATRLLAANAQTNPDSNNLNMVRDLKLISGGVPVKMQNEVIGAIGVGGSGSAVQHKACALKAIAEVMPFLSTSK